MNNSREEEMEEKDETDNIHLGWSGRKLLRTQDDKQ